MLFHKNFINFIFGNKILFLNNLYFFRLFGKGFKKTLPFIKVYRWKLYFLAANDLLYQIFQERSFIKKIYIWSNYNFRNSEFQQFLLYQMIGKVFCWNLIQFKFNSPITFVPFNDFISQKYMIRITPCTE